MKSIAINASTVKVFHKQVRAALAVCAAKSGLNIHNSGCRFSSTEMKFTITIRPETINGQDARRIAFNNSCSLCHLKPKHYLTIFNHGTEFYKIVGINSRRRKNPIEVERTSDGKKFIFPPAIVWQCLGIVDIEAF